VRAPGAAGSAAEKYVRMWRLRVNACLADVMGCGQYIRGHACQVVKVYSVPETVGRDGADRWHAAAAHQALPRPASQAAGGLLCGHGGRRRALLPVRGSELSGDPICKAPCTNAGPPHCATPAADGALAPAAQRACVVPRPLLTRMPLCAQDCACEQPRAPRARMPRARHNSQLWQCVSRMPSRERTCPGEAPAQAARASALALADSKLVMLC